MTDLCACCLRPVGSGAAHRSLAADSLSGVRGVEAQAVGASMDEDGGRGGCSEPSGSSPGGCGCGSDSGSLGVSTGCGGECDGEDGDLGNLKLDWLRAVLPGALPRDLRSVAPEDCGDLCAAATEDIAAYRQCMFQCLGITAPKTGGGGDTGCPNDDGPYFSLPAITATNFSTQWCFAYEFGVLAWPETGCCPPPINATTDCEPPTVLEWLTMFLRVPVDGNSHADELIENDAASPASPSSSDYELFSAGFAVLIKNLDIVRWVTCLTQEWSPELASLDIVNRLDALLTAGSDGTFPLTVTYVGAALNDDGTPNGATMWAFTDYRPANDGTVGLIVPVGHSVWRDQVSIWDAGGADAFCAAVQVAGSILHELIHICGDVASVGDCQAEPLLNQPGALHDCNPQGCWDESRMIGTMFLWAMAQRYSCLDGIDGCQCMSQDEYFAYSVSSLAQHYGSC